MFGLFGRQTGRRKPGTIVNPAPARVSTKTSIRLPGGEIPYTLTQSRLARNIRLTINPKTGLEVVVPRRVSRARVDAFIEEKEKWIRKHLLEIEENRKLSAKRFTQGSVIQIFGEPYTLRFKPSIKKAASVKEGRSIKFKAGLAQFSETEIFIYSRALDNGIKAALTHARPQLEKFFRKKAEKYFSRRVPELAAKMGVNFKRITVRGQQSRWGSCSAENNLNFNWRLAFYDTSVADYVIYHELAHTIHHNHSKRFYTLLGKACPEYKALRKRLRNEQAF